MGLPLLLAATLSTALQSPLLPPADRLVPVPARDVHLAAGSFWGPRVATNLLVSLQHGAQMLEEHGQFGNFRMAAAKQGHALPAGDVAPDKYAGCFYYDSDAYKWLEACCLALQQDAPEGTDPAAVAAAKADIRSRVDRFVEEIAAAQRDDGYLNTQYLVEGWTPFSKLVSDHELYCAGHLIQAACAHHDATGNRRLIDVALRFADLIDHTFGPDTAKGQRKGCCGHPEIETALVQLSHHTGEKRWLDLACFFLECRGHGLVGGDEYHQDDKPIREQREAHGHAVRQLYLCSGVLGVGEETGDAGLIDANLAIWNDIVRGKLYVTGGLGARPDGEAFGAPFELPNEHAYSETCASVAWMRWNDELLQATGDSKYADALETTLYNAFLASTGTDGKSFFYVNPLESRGGVHREPWYWCACCPPNIMRTFAGLPGWFASTTKDTLFIHLYDDCTIDATLGDGRKVKVKLDVDTSNQDEKGYVAIKVLNAPREGFRLALRIPDRCSREAQPPGAVVVRGYRFYSWPEDVRPSVEGDRAEVDVETCRVPEFVAADPRVADDAGSVALRNGPFVYAFESGIQPGDPFEWSVETSTPIESPRESEGARSLRVPGVVVERAGTGDLYRRLGTMTARSRSLIAVPYYAWAEQRDVEMRVWIPMAPYVYDFHDDVAFLRQHADAVVLQAEGTGPIVVSPKLSGRVMTSAFQEDADGFGLVNRDAIETGPVSRGFANYGGEDRVWLAPEGGPWGLFFNAGVEQVVANWSVPADMDGGPRALKEADSRRAILGPFHVDVPYGSGKVGSVCIDRMIEALSRLDVAALLGKPLGATVDVVAFRSTNKLSWSDAPPPDALIGLWTLGQFTPSDRTTVLVPFRGDALGSSADPAAIAAACIKRDYFGVVPDDRLKIELPPGPKATGLARFKADSQLRSKIGVSAAGATGWIGAWDEDRGVLTLINHTLPPPGARVPDCDWRVPNPHAAQGDVATSYNNGSDPRFFELESLSAALPCEPGASVEHVSTTIHLGGDRAALKEIAHAVLHADI